MRVVLLANEQAGRGRARRVALRTAEFLAASAVGNHDVDLASVGPGADNASAADRIARAQVVVASGGDGTVLHAARTILALPVGAPAPALYHLPCGNENLFAREFGMTRSPGTLARALGANETHRTDAGWISADGLPPELFLIMASIGPDASVIHRLANRPRLWAGHAAYTGPIYDELRDPRFPALRIQSEQQVISADDRGIFIVANSRQYALRLDPARRARTDDGLLDAVWLPCRTRVRALRWALQCRFGRHLRDGTARYQQAPSVHVESADGRPLPVQVDGEAFAPGRDVRSLVVTVAPAVLSVLLPA